MMRKAKIVCTIGPIPEDRIPATIEDFIRAGMDVARINMAHIDLSRDENRGYLETLIAAIRQAADRLSRPVAIMGDIQGPKVRIREFFGRFQGLHRVRLGKGDEFVLASEAPDAAAGGARLGYEGDFRFFDDLRNTVKLDADGRPRPIEFWFGDGRVIMETTVADITPDSARCRVIVAGEIKRGQGVTVKNAGIQPGGYRPASYPKDRADIDFLLQQRVDLIALSFVNSADDIRELQAYVHPRATDLGLLEAGGIKGFPVIAKIETEPGMANLAEIQSLCYGIMVARGDLGLRAGLESIGVYQKQIIDQCVTQGRPVITATQMLLSMTEFREPKRPEVTDVTNAVFDGTDALMLSEETADPDSKFPREAIATMAEIARIAEQEIERLNQREYKYQVERRYDKIRDRRTEQRADLEGRRQAGRVTDEEYQAGLQLLAQREIADDVSYNACKLAFELDCRAIVVLTGTGGTARIVSRFKPGAPILAGVYRPEIARLLALSYGVESFLIRREDAGYPFAELEQVISQARERKLLDPGDRVVLVSRYPRREVDTATLLNIYQVR